MSSGAAGTMIEDMRGVPRNDEQHGSIGRSTAWPHCELTARRTAAVEERRAAVRARLEQSWAGADADVARRARTRRLDVHGEGAALHRRRRARKPRARRPTRTCSRPRTAPCSRPAARRSASRRTTSPSTARSSTGLRKAVELGVDELEVVSDSELLVKQMRGEYRVKNEALRELSPRGQRPRRQVGIGASPIRPSGASTTSSPTGSSTRRSTRVD